MNRRIYIYSLILFLLSSGCASPRPGVVGPEKIDHGESEIIEAAAKSGVNYRTVVDGCLRRDRNSLHTLFSLTINPNVDGAAAEGHAEVLGNLLRRLGDETFGETLLDEPQSTRRAVQIQLFFDFGADETRLSKDDLARWYPLTFRN
jgi:hypothetical protein